MRHKRVPINGDFLPTANGQMINHIITNGNPRKVGDEYLRGRWRKNCMKPCAHHRKRSSEAAKKCSQKHLLLMIKIAIVTCYPTVVFGSFLWSKDHWMEYAGKAGPLLTLPHWLTQGLYGLAPLPYLNQTSLLCFANLFWSGRWSWSRGCSRGMCQCQLRDTGRYTCNILAFVHTGTRRTAFNTFITAMESLVLLVNQAGLAGRTEVKAFVVGVSCLLFCSATRN